MKKYIIITTLLVGNTVWAMEPEKCPLTQIIRQHSGVPSRNDCFLYSLKPSQWFTFIISSPTHRYKMIDQYKTVRQKKFLAKL